jgi:hypothetical protein
MAIQMERIEAFLIAERLKFRSHPDGHIVVGFATSNYEMPAEGGNASERPKSLAIAVRLSEEGEYLELLAPRLYDLACCHHRDVAMQALLAIMQKTKMIRFDWDPDDGEVRCSVECPLEDGMLTRRQFSRMLRGLAELIDQWDPVIRTAMETGKLRLDAAPAATC